MRTAGRAIVGVREAEEVDHVCGLPGGHVLRIHGAGRNFEPVTEHTS